ncbi:MAG: hypothetical protein J3Q66DRAFT_386373 [Benniella sp.]|nr:MAG: hypothetical protein J3Q66DRAFT_386373 [Benniella sp.]
MADTATRKHGQENTPLLDPNHTQEQAPQHVVASMPTDVHVVKVDRLQHHREMIRDRFSAKWWLECIIILAVFSVTGSSTMMLVRPLMAFLGLTGSFRAGPWSYRIAYIVLTLPLYTCMLLLISTLACRRPYFEHILIRMWSWILPRRITDRWNSS